MSSDESKIHIETGISGLRLVELTIDDAPEYYRLVDSNRGHLTKYGDYREYREATPDEIAAQLADPADENAKFGIWLEDVLIGRVDLSPRAPGHFVLGYWLGQDFTGHGYATMACRALIEYGRRELGATDIFAGVTKGNVESEALVGRLGMLLVEDEGKYNLFRLQLD